MTKHPRRTPPQPGPTPATRELLARYVGLIGPRGEETVQSRALLDAHDDKLFHALAVQARELRVEFLAVCRRST
jgi:hypothetical protein